MIPDLRRRWAIESLQQLGYFRDIQWLDSIDSTNRFLDRQIKEGLAPVPCLAIADKQTAGAGRSGNRWFSPQGCLMFSMAINHAPASSAKLPLQVGLAVAQAIRPLSRSQPKVKWPNDVYVEDRKICGILIESNSIGHLGYAIIGIGINCQVDLNLAPVDVRQNAVSLHEVLVPGQTNESVSCESVLIAVLQNWLELSSVCKSQPDWIDQNWPHWDWLADRTVQVQQPSRTLVGKADGIAPDGSLRLIDSQANRHTILSGTVRLVDENHAQ
ncbi:MAG: biotin--[acetyl-CoA-carboxylase] ligase [Planctomycetaceae bacterium]|jgi:BirA family biotin operon repressor/biotin-[acetyl-CoA-carboxylase] ligase|nr:biotin--[acetyl-CoA-carboxylase] ligase [Planctomycetaceae bacterium]